MRLQEVIDIMDQEIEPRYRTGNPWYIPKKKRKKLAKKEKTQDPLERYNNNLDPSNFNVS